MSGSPDPATPDSDSADSSAAAGTTASASQSTAPVQAGARVLLHYTARTTEGGIYETSRKRDPLPCVAGGRQLIQGVSQALVGMVPGVPRTVTLPPEQAFGVRRPELEQKLPLVSLPDHLCEGDQMTVTTEGETIDVWVRERTEETAIVDANHPLAGETLVFELEIVSVEPAAG